jgi:Ca2+/Na+ antiporter
MFVGSFFIQYFLMSPIMVSKRIYITNDLGKAYMAVIMALFMVVLEIMMHDHQYHVLSLHLYCILIAGLVLFIYLYRKQFAIKDKQYLEEMIEHHSMALLTSEELLKKTDNYDVAKLAKNIIQTQNDEIRTMRNLLLK